MRKSVLGFILDHKLENVVLIKKNRPSFQKDYYNGIGGKLEEGEDYLTALVREVEEETGLIISKEKWCRCGEFGRLDNSDNIRDWEVAVFYTTTSLEQIKSAQSLTDEKVEVIEIREQDKYLMFPNTRAMINLLVQFLVDRTWYFNIKIK